MEQALYAIIYFMRYFQGYTRGAMVFFRTDHVALKWLMTFTCDDDLYNWSITEMQGYFTWSIEQWAMLTDRCGHTGTASISNTLPVLSSSVKIGSVGGMIPLIAMSTARLMIMTIWMRMIYASWDLERARQVAWGQGSYTVMRDGNAKVPAEQHHTAGKASGQRSLCLATQRQKLAARPCTRLSTITDESLNKQPK